MMKVENIHKSFGKNQVLKGVDLKIPEAQVTAVLGPNGSGKTTILKILLGLVKPDKGSLFWNSKIDFGDFKYRGKNWLSTPDSPVSGKSESPGVIWHDQ